MSPNDPKSWTRFTVVENKPRRKFTPRHYELDNVAPRPDEATHNMPVLRCNHSRFGALLLSYTI